MNTAQITEPIAKAFRPIAPHVTFIVALIYLLGVGIAMWMIQGVLAQPSDDAYRTTQKAKFTQASFDNSAIEKVKNLRDDLSNTEIDIDSQRATPFQ